ncbi:unnamed protein product [Peniophora sp. CBMAI 1063]|nr:unnamed protein product [Peniophora sp. CBMAI 1063]
MSAQNARAAVTEMVVVDRLAPRPPRENTTAYLRSHKFASSVPTLTTPYPEAARATHTLQYSQGPTSPETISNEYASDSLT